MIVTSKSLDLVIWWEHDPLATSQIRYFNYILFVLHTTAGCSKGVDVKNSVYERFLQVLWGRSIITGLLKVFCFFDCSALVESCEEPLVIVGVFEIEETCSMSINIDSESLGEESSWFGSVLVHVSWFDSVLEDAASVVLRVDTVLEEETCFDLIDFDLVEVYVLIGDSWSTAVFLVSTCFDSVGIIFSFSYLLEVLSASER